MDVVSFSYLESLFYPTPEWEGQRRKTEMALKLKIIMEFGGYRCG